MRINTALLAIIVTLLMGMFSWVVSVEIRLSQTATLQEYGTRLKTLEDNMMPLLVEFKVQEILKTKIVKPAAIPTAKRDARKWAEAQMSPKEE